MTLQTPTKSPTIASSAALEIRREMRRRVDRDIRGFEGWYAAAKGARYLETEERAVLEALDLKPDSTAIDGGCGAGLFTVLMAPHCRWVRAIDFSATAVEATLARARELGCTNVNGATGDIVEGIPGEPADRILSVQVLPLIPTPEERLKALQSLRDALRPGGRLVLTVFNGGRIADRLRGRDREQNETRNAANTWCYRYFFTARELEAVIRASGFDEVRVRPVVNLPGRLYHWREARWLALLDRLLERVALGRGFGIYLVASAVKR